jgi:hypothetical protein
MIAECCKENLCMEIYKAKGDTSLKMVTFIKELSKMVNLMDRPCSSQKIFTLWENLNIMMLNVKLR